MKLLKRLAAFTAVLFLVSMSLGFTSMAAEDGFSAFCHIHYPGIGWSQTAGDNIPVSRSDTFVTALAIGVDGQPNGMDGTAAYEVYQNGAWSPTAENFAQIGNPSDPIEAIRIRLTGSVSRSYDICYKVNAGGNWTGWTRDGGEAGNAGSGTGISGLRVSIVRKGEADPDEAIKAAGRVIDPSKPMVALTFDDGPRAQYTNRILAALESVGGRATFFMLGQSVTGANADAVRRMVADGCEVGNHTWNHTYLTKLSSDGIVSDLGKTDQAIADACGVSPVVMRPPGGYKSDAALATLGQMGKPAIFWSVDPQDWKTRNAQSTIDHVLSKVRDGDIILMHDIYDPTAAAAEVIIPELVNRGYQLLTISELAAMRGGAEPGKAYYSFRQ